MLLTSVGLPNSPDLRDVGRAQPGHPAPALERLDQRALLAAHVGARAAAQVDARQRRRRIRLQRADRTLERRTHTRVLVAQVDVAVGAAGGPGADQHAFEHPVRIPLQQHPVLEGAGLALVGVDHHQPGLRLGRDDAPLAAGGEARTAQAPQSRGLQFVEDLRGRTAAGGQRAQHPVGARNLARAEGYLVRRPVARLRRNRGTRRLPGRPAFAQPRSDGVRDRLHVRGRHRMPAHDRHGRLRATPHARDPLDPHLRAQHCLQALREFVGAGHRAGKRIADPHGEPGRRLAALLHHVEVMIETGHLEDLGLGQAHLRGERGEHRCRQVPFGVLDAMQVLDQEIAAARSIGQQLAHARDCDRVGLPALVAAHRPPELYGLHCGQSSRSTRSRCSGTRAGQPSCSSMRWRSVSAASGSPWHR